MNINELYAIDDWDNREEEQPEITTEEEELLIQASSCSDGYTNLNIQQEDIDTMILDTLERFRWLYKPKHTT